MEHQLLVDTLRMLSDRLEHLEYHAKLNSLHQQAKIEDHPHRERIEHLQAQLGKAMTVAQNKRKFHLVLDCMTGQKVLMQYEISQDQMTKIINQYKEYIWLTLGVKLQFNFAAKDVPLMTPPAIALDRNRIIGKWMRDNCIIVDMGAGSGTDTLSFFNHIKPKTVYAVEDSSDTLRNMRLQRNVNMFLDAFKFPREIVQYRFDGYENFMMSKEVNNIDLLYVDPPWLLNGSKIEASPDEIVNFVSDTVFKPMKRNEVGVTMFCIKLRFPWGQCSKILDMLNEGIHDENERYRRIMEFDATPFNRQISFHFFIKNTPVEHEHVNDAAENFAYKNIPLPDDYHLPVWHDKLHEKHSKPQKERREVTIRKGNGKSETKSVEEQVIFDEKSKLVDDEFWETVERNKSKKK